MLIGLTGGIASGKSTVSSTFKGLGASIIDADKIAKEVVLPKGEALIKLVKNFGQEILFNDGSLNRLKLSSIIFDSSTKRKQLERILHPYILNKTLEMIRLYNNKSSDSVIVWDIPLLYEHKLTYLVNLSVVVYSNKDNQLERLMKRSALTEKEALLRINSQISTEKKKSLSDFVFDNNGSLEKVRQQVIEFWKVQIRGG